MKRILSILLIGMLLIGALTGCAKREADAEPTMQLDMAQMVATAAGSEVTNGEPFVRERVAAPERFTFTSEEDKLVISADATVYVPDVSNMPMYRIAAADFSQEQVSLFWDALVGDRQLIRQRERDEFTRAEIERLIAMYQTRLTELPNNEMQYHTDLSPEEWLRAEEERIRGEIEELRAKLKDAPETLAPVPEDGTLRKMDAYGVNDIGVVGTYDGLDAYSDGVCSFEVKNNPVYTRKYGPRVGAKLVYGSNGIGMISRGNWVEDAVPVDETTALSGEQLAQIGYTPAEAKALAEALIEKAGVPFAVKRMWLFEASKKIRIEQGLPESAAHFVYHVECERIVGGAACATGFQTAYDTSGSDPVYYAEWAYESFDLMVDRSGVACFCWDSPYTVVEALVTDSTLLPFSEIQPIFERLMRVTWQEQTEGIAKLTLYVTEARLEMMRIREADSWSSGLLVPVWNFYGVRERTFLEDFNNETDRTIKIQLLTVNAIDGSIIDPYKGY